ncbi:aminotransferase class I/II-fold pyridoxal phosphate-dependent enzyme [Kitasatospora sp. NPDC006697]|uniref:aminotransferase class I/II-fold pyridoxal phosphate-dependent enzyme n=1 Tax=Kitasatospora sp. NPDC006697 TaxID=3364020 RepID=UPI0036C9EAA6
MPFDPQVQAMRAAKAAGAVRPLYTMGIDEARAADLAAIQADAGRPEPVGAVTDTELPGPDGALPVRVYRPEGEGPFPVLVYYFGGGWTLGSIDTSDAICRALTNAAGCVTIAVGYRLAPEHRFPAAVFDCLAALEWAAEQAPEYGGDPARLAVGGDSAGGNLAAVISLLARDQDGPAISAQLLVYPNTDHASATASMAENDDPLFFNHRSVDWYWNHYLADPADGADFKASPLRAADHSGLPPALVITAEYDPLRDEGEAYAAKLAEAGTEVELSRYDGVVHGFFAMSGVLDAGRKAMAQAAGFLRRRLAPQAPVLLRQDELHGSLSDPVLDAMNFLNEVTYRFPEAISFAPGRPYEGFFEVEQIDEYLRRYLDRLAEDGLDRDRVRTQLFQYGRTNGQIHQLIARHLANDESIEVPAESVVVTAGCQEAMLLALRALCTGPGDVLLVSSPAYVGITGAARVLDIEIAPVPEGPDGLEPAAVAAVARELRAAGKRPRALYLVPDFANPSGTTLPLEVRRELLALAGEQDLLILEDNPYGFFVREGSPLPTLKSLDTAHRVLYLGSFAKTAFPGARVGYLVADQPVLGADGGRGLLADQLSKIKSMTTVNTSAVSQAVIGGMLIACDCKLREANAPAVAHYRNALETLLTELAKAFPVDRQDGPDGHGVSWNRPRGGFFLVVDVPVPIDQAALERSAREFGVLFTPMGDFYLHDAGSHQLRLSCSYLSDDQIAEGVGRLAAFLTAERARTVSGRNRTDG